MDNINWQQVEEITSTYKRATLEISSGKHLEYWEHDIKEAIEEIDNKILASPERKDLPIIKENYQHLIQLINKVRSVLNGPYTAQSKNMFLKILSSGILAAYKRQEQGSDILKQLFK